MLNLRSFSHAPAKPVVGVGAVAAVGFDTILRITSHDGGGGTGFDAMCENGLRVG